MPRRSLSLLAFVTACGGSSASTIAELSPPHVDAGDAAPGDVGAPRIDAGGAGPADGGTDGAELDAAADADVDAGPCPGFTEWQIPPSSCLWVNTEFTATHLSLDEAGAPICATHYAFGTDGVCLKTAIEPLTIWISDTAIVGDRMLYVNASCPPADCP